MRLTAAYWLALGLVLLGAGCSNQSGEVTTVLSAADLQTDLAARLSDSGEPAKSVMCMKDLRGAIDRTARCEVVFGIADSVTAVVTTTKVEGARIIYEITRPELTKDQLAARVAGVEPGQTATCDTGLAGNVGDWTQCVLDRNGGTRSELVEVKGIDGLKMDLNVIPMLPQEQVEDTLATRLTPSYGARPDTAACPGDLVGTKGNTMECAVTVGENRDRYVLTVIDAGNGRIDFDYQTWAAATGEGPDIDYCKGCPG